MSQRTNVGRDADDWDTDPDYIRDMDEMSQRWGGHRTVGSINMNELIDDVRRKHSEMEESFKRTHRLSDFPAPPSSQERLSSAHQKSTNEVRREFITSEKSSYIKESNGSILTETVRETTTPGSYSSTKTSHKSNIPPLAPKPEQLASKFAKQSMPTGHVREKPNDTIIVTDPPRQFKEYSNTRKIFEESANSNESNCERAKGRQSSARTEAVTRSIQDKIDAFKKEFGNIEQNISKKSDLSKVIKKSTNVEQKSDNVQYVSRSNEKLSSSNSRTGSPSQQKSTRVDFDRPNSTSPWHGKTKPNTSIKSLSDKFESLGRESSDDFRRRMEERRQEFFDRIKSQVRETRKGLDGFDIQDSDEELGAVKYNQGNFVGQSSARGKASSTSPYSSSQAFKLSNDSLGSAKPKVYTKRETTQEEIVSRIVKENDKIIHDETKRNVEKTSSCHGSSDEEPSSIKFIDRELRTASPQGRGSSPVDEIKRKIPVIEPDVKGAGLMARTLYDYQASEHDELTFDVDDLITHIEKVDQGWYKGVMTKDGVKRVGLFPANYVKLLNDGGDY